MFMLVIIWKADVKKQGKVFLTVRFNGQSFLYTQSKTCETGRKEAMRH